MVTVPMPMPVNSGHIVCQTVMPPERKYWPMPTSRNSIGIAPKNRKIKYGIKKAPVVVEWLRGMQINKKN